MTRTSSCTLRPALPRQAADRLYPDEALLRTALRGAAAYGLAWFDAHLWAYAEHYGVRELVSEDFQDGRHYGIVRIRNPFPR